MAVASVTHMGATAAEPGDPSMAGLRVAQRQALTRAGLGVERLDGLAVRQRWAAAMPDLRLEAMRVIERDGRATVRMRDAVWSGDVTAVDDRGDGLRLRAELKWSLAGLFHASGELSVQRERRAVAAARRALLEEVTAAWFDWVAACEQSGGAQPPPAALVMAAARLEILTGHPAPTVGAHSSEVDRPMMPQRGTDAR